MGSLTDFVVPTSEVAVPGSDTSITVRGLSVEDVAGLIRVHGEELNRVYEINIQGQDDLPPAMEIAKALMVTAPLAVAEIIALANDSPKSFSIVRKLPAPVQIEALTQIAVLTFHSEAEVKKLVETVISGSSLMTRMLTTLGSPT
jgi:hypothetical protein